MIDLTDKYLSKPIYDESGMPVNPNLAFLMQEINNFNILVMQGGTRSGKTYSTIQFMCANMMLYSGVKYAIFRQSLPVLKKTLLDDFIEIATNMQFYDETHYNKTDQVYRFNGNTLWFLSGEDEGKLRGFKGDLVYINEAPELEWESVKQILYRLEAKLLMDYNPSYPESWMYDNILTRNNVAFIRTTYKNNPYIKKTQLEEIEWTRINKPEEYLVYGLGERGKKSGTVYTDFNRLPDEDFPTHEADIWAIDFGFTPHPTVILRISAQQKGRVMYIDEVTYSTELLTEDIIAHLFFNGFDKAKHTLIVDSAQPMNITQLRFGIKLTEEAIYDIIYKLKYDITHDITDATVQELRLFMSTGMSVIPAIKPKNSINSGIRMVKATKVYVTDSSKNIWKEYYAYSYKRNRLTGEITGEVIKENDHAMDCIRYVRIWKFYNP